MFFEPHFNNLPVTELVEVKDAAIIRFANNFLASTKSFLASMKNPGSERFSSSLINHHQQE
jgi:hypothetical protein